jgi:type II secretory pathway component PulF
MPVSALKQYETAYSKQDKQVSRKKKGKKKKNAMSNIEEFSMFVYTFSFLVKDGYQPKRAIEILYAQAQGALKDALQSVVRLVDGGEPIAQAFQKSGFFPSDFCAIIEVGEGSGYLGEALEAYGEYIEKVVHMRKGLESMLNYPAFVLAFVIVSAVALLMFVVPQLMSSFQAIEVDPSQIPLVSKFLFATSGFFQKIGKVPSIIFALFLGWYLVKGGGKAKIARSFDLIPAMRKVKDKLAWAQWLVLGSICLQAGMTMQNMLRTLKSSAPKQLAKSYDLLISNVSAGNSLSDELGKIKGVPAIIPQVLGVAEKSGRVQEAMSSIGRQYLYTLNYDVKNLSGVIEPLVIGIVTLFGGGFAGSLFYTTISITSNVH